MVTQLPVAVPRSDLAPGIGSTRADGLVAAWLSGRSARTVEAYRQDLGAFRRFLGLSTISAAAAHLLGRGPAQANEVALAYRSHMLGRGLSAATVNRHLSALRSLVHLARTLGYVSFTLEVEGLPADPVRETRGPGLSAVRALLAEAAIRQDPKGVRDQALLRCLFDLGLRRAEAVSLDVADLDLAGSQLWVRGKGKRGRSAVTLPEPTRRALATWLAVRGEAEGPIFLNFSRASRPARLTGTSVYRVVRAFGQAIGERVRPHGLRHSAITVALDLTGGDVRRVQRFSRHRDVRTVQRYDDSRQDLAGEIARIVAGAARP